MECAGSDKLVAYTRYPAVAVQAHGATIRARLDRAAVLLALCAVWGYVIYVALSAVL